ncbi:hypothetical protein BD414DRAFT_376909, partial [Trametes punicea]
MSSIKFSSDDSVRIPRLEANGSNWVLYKVRLTWAAAAKGVAEHLDGKSSAPVALPLTAGQDATAAVGATPKAPDVTAAQTGVTTAGGHTAALATWEKGEAAVKQLIASTIPDSLFMKIRNLATAHEIWEAIGKEFEKKSRMVTVDL